MWGYTPYEEIGERQSISTDRLAYKQNNTNRQAVVVALRRRFGTFAETWQPNRFSRANPIPGDMLWTQ